MAPLAASAAPPLRLEGVSYAVRGVTLLSGLDLTLRPGVCTILLGPNGAGKSLTLRLLHGLLRPSAGRVLHGEADVTAGPLRGALVFQRPILLRRSALDNIAYALALQGVPRAERRERAQAALERVGLGALADRQARRLSIGEQQRVALARAWACVGNGTVKDTGPLQGASRLTVPGLVLLDEPTASLDPAATKTIEAILHEMHAAGTTLAMTTHDLAQARRLADEVVFLHRGRVLEQAPAARFFAEPATPEARTFSRGELPW